MDRFKIDIVENCYSIFDMEERTFVIEGISEWQTACELHEMVTGETED